MNKFKQVLVIGIFSCMTSNVMALPSISGSIDMLGAAPDLYDVNNNNTKIASDAVKVVFDPGQFLVVAAENDLSGLLKQVGTIKDIPFDPFAGLIVDFWTVGGFSFDLLSIARGVSNEPATILVLHGTGLIRDLSIAPAFEDTVASWSFSTDTTGTSGLFSWNATSASAVPEPGILMLLTTGLFGLSLRKRI